MKIKNVELAELGDFVLPFIAYSSGHLSGSGYSDINLSLGMGAAYGCIFWSVKSLFLLAEQVWEQRRHLRSKP
jgi:hypothetical protein